MDLQGVVFGSVEILKHSDSENILQRTNLEGTWFERSDLRRANFGRTNLKNSSFYRANLAEATFWVADAQGANFRNSNLQNTDFYASVLKDARFNGASMHGINLHTAVLAGAEIRADSLNGGIIQEDIKMYREYFYRWYTNDSIKNNYMHLYLDSRYAHAREIYVSLKNAFLDSGRYDDASWAYFKERQMERKMHSPFQARKWYHKEIQESDSYWRRTRLFTRYAVNWLKLIVTELSTGYGEKPLRVIGVSIVIMLLFTLLYWASDGVYSTSAQDISWADYLNYSIATFSTIGFPDLVPRNNISKFLTSLQALLGISLLALFMYSLGRRIGGS